MFKNKKLITNLKKDNRILKHNNELLVKKDIVLLRAMSEFKGYTKEQQYGSIDNLLNKMRKTLADLEKQLESL